MKNSTLQDELLTQVRQATQDNQRLAVMNAELLKALARGCRSLAFLSDRQRESESAGRY
jgi:hypothetical protein